MVYMLTASYILYFYEDILGVSAVFTGILLLAARVFDAANDPVMGILVARTKSRFGRFRPWLFSGTIVNALVLFHLLSYHFPLTFVHKQKSQTALTLKNIS